MFPEMSVEKACGQVLFSLKLSNLNYMVKETPFSAYVTIRKKFVKNVHTVTSVNEDTAENASENDNNEYVRKLEKENALLQKKVKDILTENAHLRFDVEEFEIKFNALEKEKATIEIKLEEAVDKLTEVEKNIENSAISHKRLESNSAKVFSENKSLTDNLEKAGKLIKEKHDLVNILEATLENKNTEVDDVKVQLTKAFTEIEELKGSLKDIQECQFRCENCEFHASTNDLLQEHMKEHEPTCEFCGLKFKNGETMKKHTCKLNIVNAEFKQLFSLS